MFVKFNQKLPEYEVICPQSKKSFTIRSMNVSGEENLKGSFIISVKMIEHLNRCIFDSIVTFPPDIQNFEDFLQKVSTIDRGALLYGLYHITYGEIRNYDITCGACENSYSVTIKSDDTFHIKPYDGEDDLYIKIIPVPLEVFSNVVAYVKQPNLKEEFETLKVFSPQLGNQTGIANDILIIDKIEERNDAGDTINLYTSKNDLVDAYRNLSPKDKRIIHRAYENNFGQYAVSLKMKSSCTKCGAVEDVTIDLVTQFLRMVWSV